MSFVKKTTYSIPGTGIHVIPCMDVGGHVRLEYDGKVIFTVKNQQAESLSDALQEAALDAQNHIESLENK